MEVVFDPAKRELTMQKRGLDFADAPKVFAGRHMTTVDDRRVYGEVRYITTGRLDGRMVVLVWTERGEGRRIISMRKANDREQDAYGPELD